MTAILPTPVLGQGLFEELGTPLREVTFVVVDLETTGGSPHESAITEVGAVKLRGGEVIGEFATLVNPGTPIPAFIQVLTGISSAMVATAPRIETVLPAFLEFARGAVLVAHNAGFDIGFLKAAAAATGVPWPRPTVLDTVTLARQTLSRDEAPNCKLSTLAALFRTKTQPDHRALHDARATAEVLHALIERVGNLGVHSLEELASYTSKVTEAQRRKRHLADTLPTSPGVYIFRDDRGRALYVGTSHNIRARARTYFTASEQRSRMAHMVAQASVIHAIECQTVLEAQVQELRLIASERPRYNRRSTRPEHVVWLKLTVEPFPRLSIVREVRPDGAPYAGPFRSRAAAENAVAALHEALPIRQCSDRLPMRPRERACALAEIDRCLAPCVDPERRSDYARVVDQAAGVLIGDGVGVYRSLRQRMRELAHQERFEDAAAVKARFSALVSGAARMQRMAPLASVPELIAAKRHPMGGWELVCIRYGRLAGSAVTPRGADPHPTISVLRATSEAVAAPVGPVPAALPEEAQMVLGWLESDGVRIVDIDGEWSCPVGGAQAARARYLVTTVGA
ncbi:MAG: DEDD exonuclease domain-containing protein [Dermatophilaceae bacterium]